MSQINLASHPEILHFPKDGKPVLTPNEWQVWSDSQDEGAHFESPDLDHGAHKVLVPFAWWIAHHHEVDIQSKAKAGQIGVWFATDDDILRHVDVIEAGKEVWPLVAAHFPIFRDGRSFSTAALLRDRFQWQGEIRAIGDVLIDQLLQGARVGFDSFALRPDQQLDVALKQFDLFTFTTQNSWRDKRATLSA
ncbi:DUF934 domain-containing protein [Polynucleobacter ibericus]|uniref:DUF934 domain-containing protein n=1 Tax=Polynucleobacter ibericus TaxID=1819725 RepID=UPI001BFDA4AA|nr:DUF934 domain-containing protein [Polynucleobacter ibericus]QWE08982.1 DUF934 domain-containing protein [Polynucleobacter ibericus]